MAVTPIFWNSHLVPMSPGLFLPPSWFPPFEDPLLYVFCFARVWCRASANFPEGLSLSASGFAFNSPLMKAFIPPLLSSFLSSPRARARCVSTPPMRDCYLLDPIRSGTTSLMLSLFPRSWPIPDFSVSRWRPPSYPPTQELPPCISPLLCSPSLGGKTHATSGLADRAEPRPSCEIGPLGPRKSSSPLLLPYRSPFVSSSDARHQALQIASTSQILLPLTRPDFPWSSRANHIPFEFSGMALSAP